MKTPEQSESPSRSRRDFVGTLAFLLAAFAAPAAGSDAVGDAPSRMPGADERIQFTDCVKVVRDEASGSAWIDRILENDRGYRWDAPGARARFRCNSAKVTVHLRYSARHLSPSRNSVGFYRIDGAARDSWRFTRPPGGKLPADTALALPLPVPGPGFHDYEIVFPYADSLELVAVEVAAGTRWEKPAPRATVRWVAFGDSITHGFTSGNVTHTYPFAVGEAKGWEAVNAGIGGRGTYAADGDFLGALDAQVFSILIGGNDWQGGVELENFRTAFRGLLAKTRVGRPKARIHVITPLWVHDSWKPAKAKYPLEDYRKTIREIVAALGDKNMALIEGPSLIDHDPALFDAVPVHPNDAGFAQMTQRLGALLRP